ncbi:MAG: Pre-mRNA-splicing factor cef1 [Cirrosporium novae-zelandiae]|nr:MAG: Pre-mRNA-splicing factor cef1 [Cirrosporium novae-zelandiae]
MPVVKGGVWTNIEDEILKASVSKYGLNQWARVSSLLARKTPKQCKARWTEWLDPGIRKIEWSKEEDEKLLHLAKLMPTQWRTIAPIVGRTATQCLERYQKLLDEAEARENDELGLGGPSGGETAAPSADDVRRLRPGELDPDPESKPARPDTIDLDEDEKEMLSEARARLANTQGKKAKRKARERQLEESRRLAVLQKRRELKNAGINIKVVTRKKGEMDYNADIPFEKAPTAGFYDTQEEQARNERQREAFDPRKQQLAIKRKGDQDDDDEDRKRRKSEKNGPTAAFAAAAKAGQMQRIREAEQSSKRKALNLPAPQISEGEMEDIVKMGRAGEQASRIASMSENEGTRGLIGNYTSIVGGTPIRTPRAAPQEDRIANELYNIRAMTQTQSSLLGGENTPLREGTGTTGFDGATPRQQVLSTPNPMATPFRQGLNGVGAPGPGATPMMTPRDNFMINREGAGAMSMVASTPRDLKLREKALRQQIHSQLSALPKPQQTEWELEELPEEKAEPQLQAELSEEDAAEIDKRKKAAGAAAEHAEFKRQTQVIQRNLPRPSLLDANVLLSQTSAISDPAEKAIAEEMALLMLNDARKFPLPDSQISGHPPSHPLSLLPDDLLAKARDEITKELSSSAAATANQAYESTFSTPTEFTLPLPPPSSPDQENPTTTPTTPTHQHLLDYFSTLQSQILTTATTGNKIEKKLSLHLGGYQNRAKILRAKITEAAAALEKERRELDSFRRLQVMEEVGTRSRLEVLREEVQSVLRREREVQDIFRERRDELEGLL